LPIKFDLCANFCFHLGRLFLSCVCLFRYKRDTTCLLLAFRDLCMQLMVQHTIALKVRILQAVGPNAQVLISAIPELERIVGPQPPVPPLSAVESQTRFHHVFLQFVSVFATAESPLVLFLDDVQWVSCWARQ